LPYATLETLIFWKHQATSPATRDATVFVAAASGNANFNWMFGCCSSENNLSIFEEGFLPTENMLSIATLLARHHI